MGLYRLLASPKPLPEECQVVHEELTRQLLVLKPATEPPLCKASCHTTHGVYDAQLSRCWYSYVPETLMQPSRWRLPALSNAFPFLCASYHPLPSSLFPTPKCPLICFLSPQISVQLLESHVITITQSIHLFSEPTCSVIYPWYTYKEFTPLLCKVCHCMNTYNLFFYYYIC